MTSSSSSSPCTTSLCTTFMAVCMYYWLITNYYLVPVIDHATPKSSKRRRHEAEAGPDNLAECKRLVAVVGGILQSTKGVEFSASVAGAGMSLSVISFHWYRFSSLTVIPAH